MKNNSVFIYFLIIGVSLILSPSFSGSVVLPSIAAEDISSSNGTSVASEREGSIKSTEENGIKVEEEESSVNNAKEQTASTQNKVSKANKRPTASAGADMKVEQGAKVVLNGQGSSDPDGDKLVFHWKQILPRNPLLIFNDESLQNPTFTAPSVTKDTTFLLVLYVGDGNGGVDNDQVKVIVKAPVAEEVQPTGSQPSVIPKNSDKAKTEDNGAITTAQTNNPSSSKKETTEAGNSVTNKDDAMPLLPFSIPNENGKGSVTVKQTGNPGEWTVKFTAKFTLQLRPALAAGIFEHSVDGEGSFILSGPIPGQDTETIIGVGGHSKGKMKFHQEFTNVNPPNICDGQLDYEDTDVKIFGTFDEKTNFIKTFRIDVVTDKVMDIRCTDPLLNRQAPAAIILFNKDNNGNLKEFELKEGSTLDSLFEVSTGDFITTEETHFAISCAKGQFSAQQAGDACGIKLDIKTNPTELNPVGKKVKSEVTVTATDTSTGAPVKGLKIELKTCPAVGNKLTDGHTHDKIKNGCSERPKGTLNHKATFTKKTDKNGQVEVTYEPPKSLNKRYFIATKDKITATAKDTEPVEIEIITKVPNLVQIPGSAGVGCPGPQTGKTVYFVSQTNHECLFYGTILTNTAILDIANEFQNRQNACVADPTSSICEVTLDNGKTTLAKIKGLPVPFGINAMSLPWGGLHDIGPGNCVVKKKICKFWDPPHATHSSGKAVDIKINDLDADRKLLLREIINNLPNTIVPCEGGSLIIPDPVCKAKGFPEVADHIHVDFPK